MRERFGDARFDILWVLDANALDADRFRHLSEIRIDEIGAVIEEAGRFLLERDEPERAVVEHEYFDRKLQLWEAQKIGHQHGEAAVAEERDHLPAGRGGWRADGLRHRVRHRSVPVRTDQPPLAVH